MANLTDYTYFTSGAIAVNNITSTGTPAAAIQASITAYITEYEPDFLLKLLGEDLYDVYAATPLDAKWATLKTMLFNGTTKKSVISNYVWTKYIKDIQIMGTAGGDKQSGDAGMIPTFNSQKFVEVWRSIRKSVTDIIDYMDLNTSTFPEWDGGASARYYFDTVNTFDI